MHMSLTLHEHVSVHLHRRVIKSEPNTLGAHAEDKPKVLKSQREKSLFSNR